MIKLLKSRSGNSTIDAAVVVLAVMLVLALAVKVAPVFSAKQQLDTFAAELCRTAETAGCVGSETTARTIRLKSETGLNPVISWSKIGNIQLNEEFTVTLTTTVNIGLFGEFASFPIILTAKATGASEVYRK
jgi:Flp pilus assembly protein TadG